MIIIRVLGSIVTVQSTGIRRTDSDATDRVNGLRHRNLWMYNTAKLTQDIA